MGCGVIVAQMDVSAGKGFDWAVGVAVAGTAVDKAASDAILLVGEAKGGSRCI